MNLIDREEEARGSRVWHGILYAYFIYVFVTGGSSQVRDWTDAIAQLLALPIIAVALWRLTELTPSRVRVYGLIAFAAVVILPWLQLLPLETAMWGLAPARNVLADDLGTAGVGAVATQWSLTPASTLRGALVLLPAAAMFLAILGVGKTTQRRLLVLCVVMPIASLVLGFLQLGAAQDSLFNEYSEWASPTGGTFANANHQGTAMLVGLGICLAFAVTAFGRRVDDFGLPRNPWPATIAGTTLLLGLPLTNSRAAVVIGVLLLVAAPLGMAASYFRRSGHGRSAVIALVLVAALGALGLSAAIGWMKVDEVEELRGILRSATTALAALHLPWGSGIGSFVPTFQQALPGPLLLPQYVNAAHNDFAQVWLEGGLAGALVALLAAVALAVAAVVHVREQRGDRRLVWASALGLCVFLAHAAADYALRTPALMTVAALLCAILVAQASRAPRP